MIILPVELEAVEKSKVIPLQAVLYYKAEDPYAVTLEVVQPQTEDVVWEFARDLLANGISERAGAGSGDVTVWRCQDGIHIALCSPEGKANLHARTKDIEDFLKLSHALVPPGTELDGIDVGAQLTKIFFGEAA